ncbi:hypothetical protein WSM22_41670 [Cytophagales bacterium WSM2-2]|nr:hypothetical protein WSM22_41670 [Cytophagales bacterium WSM2-2]
MKAKLNNLNDALTYHLEGMYRVEKKLQKFLPDCFDQAASRALKNEVKKYLSNTGDKRVKLKRIFSYLLTGPFGCKNKIIDAFMEDQTSLQKYAMTSSLRDTMLIGNLQAINSYKISMYNTAKTFAMTLELQKVVDLLQEILELEKESEHAFAKIALKEISDKTTALTTV